MRTDLIYIDTIPDEPTLTALLGVKLYSCHSILCKIATSVLAPDIERWADGSRRGKYYHGYIIEKWPLSLDMYLGEQFLKCDLHLYKRYFMRILNKKASLSTQMQESIDAALKINEEYKGGFYISFFMDEDMLQETIKILKIAFPSLDIERTK